MMLTTLLKTLYLRLSNFAESRRAQLRKRRSLEALEKLDDRLLDDVGLCRGGDGKIVSIHSGLAALTDDDDKAPAIAVISSKRRNRHLSRHPYLLRRRI